MKTLLLLTLLFITPFTGNWGLDFDKALESSKAADKPILLYFSGSDWCGPCIKLKQEVFDTPEFDNFAAENLLLVRADFPRLKKNQLAKEQLKHNEKLAGKYNASGKFPFSVLIDSNGKVLKSWDGYPKSLTVTSFINDVKPFL